VSFIIGVEPEGMVALCPRQRRVAGRCEVIDPDKIEHPRPELAGDLTRAVLRPRINDHDLIKQAGDRRETGRQFLLLIPDNHCQAY